MSEVELHPALVSPFLQRFGGELRAMIHRDRQRYPGTADDLIQGRDNVAAAKPKPWLYQGTLATKLIDDGEHTESPSIE